MKHTEAELQDIFASLIQQHKIKLCIDLPENVAFLPNPVSVDVEHDEAGNLVGIGVCKGNQCDYFTNVTPRLVNGLLQAQIIAHNGYGDFEELRSWGVPVKDEQLIWDTMLIGHVIDSSYASMGGYGLKIMAKRELGIEYPEYDDIVGTHKGKTKKTPKCPRLQSDCCGRKTLDKYPVDLVAKYCCMDAYATFQLYLKQKAYVPDYAI